MSGPNNQTRPWANICAQALADSAFPHKLAKADQLMEFCNAYQGKAKKPNRPILIANTNGKFADRVMAIKYSDK